MMQKLTHQDTWTLLISLHASGVPSACALGRQPFENLYHKIKSETQAALMLAPMFSLLL